MILRGACYERVSSEEQAKFGYSIKAQIDTLNDYCKKEQIKIVDHYTEEGVSAGKPLSKRPEMLRLIEDVKDDKIDIILFTRLDRWYRSTKYYYQVQDILDRHNIPWKAIQEDYETETANGRFKVNIMLAVAEAEREKGAERVKIVFENKRKNKIATFGEHYMPFGYKKEPDEDGIPRLVKDPELQDALQDFWDIAVKYNNVSKAAKTVNQEYGINRSLKMWRDVVYNEIYTGTYRGVEGFCEPYVSAADWKALQKKKVKRTQGNRVYLFTGLIPCPVCGRMLKSGYCTVTSSNGVRREYFSYRCEQSKFTSPLHKCNVPEIKTEKWLLANLKTFILDDITKVEIERKKPKKKKKSNAAALKEQLRRLEVIYMAGNKSDAEYLAESMELKDRIAKAEQQDKDQEDTRNLDTLKKLLETDINALYSALSREDKQRFWRSILKQINTVGNNPVSVEFL